MDAGKIIRLMVTNGMSRKHFTEKIGISDGTLSQWINGRCNPSADTVTKIADLFNVSADYLLDREQQDSCFSEDMQELARIYSVLDREGKTIVLATCYTQRQRLIQERLINGTSEAF